MKDRIDIKSSFANRSKTAYIEEHKHQLDNY